MINPLKTTILAAALAAFMTACGDDAGHKDAGSGRLVINFQHLVDGKALEVDKMQYTNAAGNTYEVSEIQWFISDLTLIDEDGNRRLLDAANFAHYVDTDLPGTLTWTLDDPVPAGNYQALAFTFGIKGEKNKPYMFTDPPESDMIWPFSMGGEEGGYHYMKLNGFWIDALQERRPFNFHLGVGQIRDAENKVTGFIQNWFETRLPESSFSIGKNETLTLTVAMEVNNWFRNPENYDHNAHGPMIMHNQTAMGMGVANGAADVFHLVR